jgi:hypothetical protein
MLKIPNLSGCFFNSKKKVVPVITGGAGSDKRSLNADVSKNGKEKDKPKEKEDENIRLETFRNKPRQLLASYAVNNRQQELSASVPKGVRYPFKSPDVVRPQQNPQQDASVNSVVVNDVLQFVHGLNLQPDKSRNPLMIGDMCALVSYEHDGFEALGNSNPLGTFLLRAALSKLDFAPNGNDVNYLIMTIDIATTFIEYMRSMEEGSDQSFWLPLQGCLALTVRTSLPLFHVCFPRSYIAAIMYMTGYRPHG